MLKMRRIYADIKNEDGGHPGVGGGNEWPISTLKVNDRFGSDNQVNPENDERSKGQADNQATSRKQSQIEAPRTSGKREK